MREEKGSWRKRATNRLRNGKTRPSIVSSLPPTTLQELFDVAPIPPKKQRVRALGRSFLCALRGLCRGLKTERNLRIHLVAMGYVTFFAYLAVLDRTSYALLALCCALVIGAELFNTAIEHLCDKTADGFNQFIRDAKDTAAAGVLVCAIGAVVVGLLLFTQDQAYLRVWQALTEQVWQLPALALTALVAIWWIL